MIPTACKKRAKNIAGPIVYIINGEAHATSFKDTTMGIGKKCYKCMTLASEDAKACPRCGARLGARTESGIAAKPGSPLWKILLALIPLLILGRIAVHSHPANSAPTPVKTSSGPETAKDAAIKTIKEKGAAALSSVGVADVGYKDDTLCVYVDQRFASLSQPQQEQLLSIVAGEWEKAIGKNSTAVKILEYGTSKPLADLVV